MTRRLVPISIYLSLLLSCNPPKEHKSFDEYPSYEENDLELLYPPTKSVFTPWAPTAEKVRLSLYASDEGGEPTRRLPVESSDKGTWRISVSEDLKGFFYAFQIRIGDKWLDKTPGIWTKAVRMSGNRAAVIDWTATDSESWEANKSPELKSFSDITIYEMHHQDFSVTANSGVTHKGKFLALAENGTEDPGDVATSVDHLKELGVTHVHILPSYGYGSVDRTRLRDNVYNWRYDPKNYNALEGSYSTDPYSPEARIREFKEMVQGLHRSGIRVTMDVVYNHTLVGDGSSFSLAVPGYFYRHKPDESYSDASGCDNETISERAMIRRYIVESVKYWAEEYRVDGFRFDLMGIHDVETMNEVKAELAKLNPSIFVCDEGWTTSDSPLPEGQRAIKVNAPKLNSVAVLSDDLRDALRGSVFETTQAGFVPGKPEGDEESTKFGTVGAIRHPQIDYNQILYCEAPYANKPAQVINYVSCRDDLCLMDKLKLPALKGATPDELIRFGRLTQTIIFTSRGVPFMRVGEELLHDKKGVHNSYQSSDSINEIDWSLEAKNKDVLNYYKDSITLRKSHPAFRIATAEGVREAPRFQEVNQPGVVAYTLGEHANGDNWKKIMVIFNGNRKVVTVSLPEGTWIPVCKDGRICLDGKGSMQGKTTVSASSASILKQD